MDNFFLSMPFLFAVAIAGMIIHFLKKQVKGETITEVKDYFSDNFKSTLTAFIVTSIFFVAYYLTLATGQPADILAVFGIGYTFDSVFNKWETDVY